MVYIQPERTVSGRDADPKTEIWAFSAAGNPLPKPEGCAGPANTANDAYSLPACQVAAEYFMMNEVE